MQVVTGNVTFLQPEGGCMQKQDGTTGSDSWRLSPPQSLLRAQTQSEAAAQMFGADSPAEGRPTPTERGAPSPQKERGGSVGAVTDPGLHTLRIRS